MKSYGVRSYIPEKKPKGRRNWAGKAEEQRAVYQNRRRVRSEYGKSLLKRRGELVERSFAHCYETGGLRRCHLRGRENILKRQLVHVGAFNLSLILRKLLGAGTPRELKNRAVSLVLRLFLWIACQFSPEGASEPGSASTGAAPAANPLSSYTQGHAESRPIAPRAAKHKAPFSAGSSAPLCCWLQTWPSYRRIHTRSWLLTPRHVASRIAGYRYLHRCR